GHGHRIADHGAELRRHTAHVAPQVALGGVAHRQGLDGVADGGRIKGAQLVEHVRGGGGHGFQWCEARIGSGPAARVEWPYANPRGGGKGYRANSTPCRLRIDSRLLCSGSDNASFTPASPIRLWAAAPRATALHHLTSPHRRIAPQATGAR